MFFVFLRFRGVPSRNERRAATFDCKLRTLRDGTQKVAARSSMAGVRFYVRRIRRRNAKRVYEIRAISKLVFAISFRVHGATFAMGRRPYTLFSEPANNNRWSPGAFRFRNKYSPSARLDGYRRLLRTCPLGGGGDVLFLRIRKRKRTK